AKIEGYPELIARLSGGNEAAARTFQDGFPEENLREELALIFGFLPGKPVTPGATCTRTENVRLGSLGTLRGEVEYIYKGKEDGNEQITLTRRLTFEPGTQPDALIKATGVKVEPGTGTILFDTGVGRLIRQELNLRLQGTFAVTDTDKKTTTY